MESNRIRYIIRRNGLLIVAIGIVGAIAASFFADVRNDSIEPRFTAVAPGTFDEVATANQDEAELLLDQGAVRAIEANAEILLSKPETRGIRVNGDLLRIEFRATEQSIAEAEDAAIELRDNWLNAPSRDAQFLVEQERVKVRMQEVAAQLEAMMPEPVDAQVDSDLRLLSQRIAALEARITGLELERLFPIDRQVADIDQEIDRATGELGRLQQLLTDSTVPPVSPFSAEGVEQRALEGEFGALEARFQEISLEISRAATPISDEVELIDDTPAAVGLQAGALLGLLLGAGLATTVLTLNDRNTQPVLESTDLPSLRALGRVRARVHGDPSEYWYHPSKVFWYHTTKEAGRKADIQAVRAALQGFRGTSVDTIAIAGLDCDSDLVHDLAADLAVSITQTHKQVLLIDADFDVPGVGAEFRGPGVTLTDVVESRGDFGMFNEDHILGLWRMPVGTPSVDPSDAIGRPHVAHFLQNASAAFAPTIVVLPDVRRPVAKAMLNHVDAAILALTVGKSPRQAVSNVVNDWDPTGAELLGFTLLEERPVWSRIKRVLGSRGSSKSYADVDQKTEPQPEVVRTPPGLPQDTTTS